MYAAHRKLVEEKGLNESHFNVVAENLVITLQELNVAQENIDEVVAICLTVKNKVLGLEDDEGDKINPGTCSNLF